MEKLLGKKLEKKNNFIPLFLFLYFFATHLILQYVCLSFPGYRQELFLNYHQKES